MFFLLHLFISSIFPLASRHPHQPSPPTVHCPGATFSRSQLWASRRCSNALKPPSIRKRTVPTLSALRGSNGFLLVAAGGLSRRYQPEIIQQGQERHFLEIPTELEAACWYKHLRVYVMVFADKPGKLRGPHLNSYQIISCATSLQLHISFI